MTIVNYDCPDIHQKFDEARAGVLIQSVVNYYNVYLNNRSCKFMQLYKHPLRNCVLRLGNMVWYGEDVFQRVRRYIDDEESAVTSYFILMSRLNYLEAVWKQYEKNKE